MSSVQAKVAAIISEYTLAINVGSSKGVEEGNTVSVKRTVTISDPDTKEILGAVSVTKLALKVNHVQGKLCTATVVSLRDVDTLSAKTIPQLKKIVTRLGDVKQGMSVYVAIGDRADIETTGFSDEPPF